MKEAKRLPPQRNACNGRMYVVVVRITHVMEEYTVFPCFLVHSLKGSQTLSVAHL